MKKILYLECSAGISGDMLVAALIDVGADQQVLDAALKSLPVSGFEYRISRVKKAGVDCCDFDVILDSEIENHDHDMEFLHGAEHHHEHEHSHEHEHYHDHIHEHCHEEAHHDHNHEHVPHEHHHHHEHRGLNDILPIIDAAAITDKAKAMAKKIFHVIAVAESKAHGVPMTEVHFHEVGAVDSIVDIVAIAVCLDNLGVDEVIVPKLAEGQGTIRCQHGILPVPVPAVANIVAEHGIKLEILPCQGEFVTPTGAAAVAALRTGTELPKDFSIIKIGQGAGKRTYERPSIVRAMLLEQSEKTASDVLTDKVFKLETDIDDCSGEVLGYVMELLLAAGARDVHYFPVFMKKNRPAYQLNVICDADKVAELENIIFAETTTIGIRHFEVERSLLQRQQVQVETPYGPAFAKVCTLNGAKKVYPEYESAAKLAREHGVALQEIYNIIKSSVN